MLSLSSGALPGLTMTPTKAALPALPPLETRALEVQIRRDPILCSHPFVHLESLLPLEQQALGRQQQEILERCTCICTSLEGTHRNRTGGHAGFPRSPVVVGACMRESECTCDVRQRLFSLVTSTV